MTDTLLALLDQYPGWAEAVQAKSLARVMGRCTLLYTVVHGDGTREEHLEPAVVAWTTRTGAVEHLCTKCLPYWIKNAIADPDLQPARMEAL